MKLNKLLIPVLGMLVAAGAYATFHKTIVKPVVHVPAPDKKQQAILQELSAVLHGMDTVTVATIKGSIEVKDLADSSNSMLASFYYSRNGNIGYYRLGENEMISLQDAYIVVSHDTKKIFLSAPREVINPMKNPPGFEVEVLTNEGFMAAKTTSAGLTRISLNNSHHATCREYSLLFDSTGIIHESAMRLTDQLNPVDKSRDKLLHVKIDSWEPGVANNELLHTNRYVSIKNGKTLPAPALNGYKVIEDR